MMLAEQSGDPCSRRAQPCVFRGAHAVPPGIRIIVGTGEVVESMGDVERQFMIGSTVIRADLHGAFHIDDQVAAPGRIFTGDRIITETDDIRGAVPAEIFAVGALDAFVVGQHNAYLVPAGGGGGVLQPPSEPISQPLQLFPVQGIFFLLV